MRGKTLVFLFLAGVTLHAREIVVEPDPAGNPVLAKAVEAADDGDTLLIKKGTYRETIVVRKSLRLNGEAGTVIDPSERFMPEWQAEPKIGKGVYRAKVVRQPYALMLDGKILAEIDQRRSEGDGAWSWKKLLAHGPPLSKLKFIRAIWMFDALENMVYLHLADDAEPAGLNWTVLWTKEPIIAVRGANGAVISGLTLSHGFTGVDLSGKSSNCTVTNCNIGPFERTGVVIREEAGDCLVEKNEIFRGAYEDWTPSEPSKERYEVWQIHKLAGFYDRVGINLVRAGANNRVHANHIYETFDGVNIGDSKVESLDIPLPNPDYGKGTEISENIIERTRDSGIELGVGCIDVKVHHNTLRQTHGGLRFKIPRIGPVFIYRNVLIDGSPFNIWYSMDDSPAEGYVYHNTIIGGKAALLYSSFNNGGHQIGAPKWHYYNNLCLGAGFFKNSGVNAPVNFTADYNMVLGSGKPWPNDKTKDQHSIYMRETPPLSKDYHPLPGNPAIDAGQNLSTFRGGKPLPGCEGSYYKGKAPDIGAFEVE